MLQTEHQAIHRALEEATTAPGRVGAAAKELAAVLGPHFKREDEIALPPLGLLAPLAAGETPAGIEAALTMTDALRKELPRMLEEHKRIRAATETLRAAAREAKASVHEQFAEDLALHARTEEEVLYPAAILVGDDLLFLGCGAARVIFGGCRIELPSALVSISLLFADLQLLVVGVGDADRLAQLIHIVLTGHGCAATHTLIA